MKYIFKGISIVIACSCLFIQEIQASTFRCNGKIVSLSDNKIDVIRKCGEPTYKYQRMEEKIIKKYQKNVPTIDGEGSKDSAADKVKVRKIDKELLGDDDEYYKGYPLAEERRLFINIEEWIYNLGPHQLLRTLIFRNNELDSIKIGEHGFKVNRSLKPAWGEAIVDIGDSTAEVLMKCGEPTFKEKQNEEQVLIDYIVDDHISRIERRIFIDIEKWFYNLGPKRLIRILNFRNNRLVSIETGERGY